jgi:hypothetical protein
VQKGSNVNIPKDAFCFFKDGNQWCCVNADFINSHESPCGFSETMLGAMDKLLEDKNEHLIKKS